MISARSLDSCGNGCGLIASFVGCLGFGSFGAPLKCATVNMVNGGKGPHPFVLQTYKSAMYFLTSWTVLLLGVEFKFTPWGIVSGLLWVIGGSCGIFGIRNAGLAISVGTWSSITVLVSFAWGIFVFGEKVQSASQTLLGVFIMIMGFVGMAYFSSPATEISNQILQLEVEEINPMNVSSLSEPLLLQSTNAATDNPSGTILDEEQIQVSTPPAVVSQNEPMACAEKKKIVCMGFKWNKKCLGVLGAVVDGILGGSNLIPMKIAPSIDRGIDYVLSFAIGAALATVFGWFVFFILKSFKTGSVKNGYKSLPSLHLQEILLPGVLSGTLWSVGNVSQILSVTFLGQSIGMSIVQSQMIISGLLGILLFQEIKGVNRIVCWVLSAALTLLGIVLLSHEHRSD